MSGVVLDASIFMASIFHEENFRDQADNAIGKALEVGAVVPEFWHYEIRNALLKTERQPRITVGEADAARRSLQGLPLVTEATPDFDAVMSLARRRGLTYYDAIYVELAVRLDAALATLDQAMMRAAEAEGVPVS